MAFNKKNERLRSLEKKYQKAQNRSLTVPLLIICSGNFRKFHKKNLSSVSAPEACRSVTKLRPQHTVFYCTFPKILKRLLLKGIQKLDGMGNMEGKLSCDL